MDCLFVEPYGSGQIRLGITTLASILRDNGFSVNIVDVSSDVAGNKYFKRSHEYFLQELKKYPKVVAFTATTPSFYYCLPAIKEARKYAGKIILGGPHATIFREKLLEKVPEVDVVVVGEAENTIVSLIDALVKEKSLAKVKGICFREGKKIRVNGPAGLISNLDEIPFPARDILELESYHSPFNVMSSRGCPYNCVYCSKPVTNTTWRSRSPKNTVDEIQQSFEKYPHLAKRANRTVGISDDNFTIDKNRAIGICDELIKRDLGINMTCATGIHVNTVSKELLDKMKLAGCSELWFGMETGNPVLLSEIGKATTLPKIREAVKASKEVGIPMVAGHFIIGLPNETLEKAKETIAFMKSLKLDLAGFNHAVPFPSTRLWDYVNKNGKILVEYEDVVDYKNFLGYGKGNVPIFETPEFTAEERKVAYEMAVNEINAMMRRSVFAPKNIVKFLKKIESPGDLIWGVNRALTMLVAKDLRDLPGREKKAEKKKS